MIQKHAATRLHFDFRLEWNGVLKSWAVPKGPPPKRGGKALAVEVEDHPLDYAKFEGTIPKGQYGGGTVMVWDEGNWSPIDDVDAGLRHGKFKFTLQGGKLSGEWALVRMRTSEGGKNNWLLINKSWDGQQAQLDDAVSEISGRSMKEISSNGDSPAKGNRGRKRSQRRRKTQMKSEASVRMKSLLALSPQLATWTADTPDGDDRLHEVKLDGYRIMAFHDAEGARLMTRRDQDWTARFPTIAKAIEEVSPPGTIIDGELVVLDISGRSDFQAMQNAIKRGASAPLAFFAFDLPFHAWKDLRRTPLCDRKGELRKLIPPSNRSFPIQYSDHIAGNGDAVAERACQMSLEGIISKKASSLYESRRTLTWLKSKCGHRQEFVVIGYTDPAGARTGIGALLLGYHEDGELRYAGRVGTGFDVDELRAIERDLAGQQRESPPVAGDIPRKEMRNAHWVTPRRVVEIRFAGWTNDNLVRQAVFLGFRQDKTAKNITREDRAMARVRTEPISNGWQPPIRLTHPDRLIFEPEKITKKMLMEYYDRVAERMLPHVIDRPLTILRCPDGASTKCFFQRHNSAGMPDAVEEVNVGSAKSPEMHLMIRDRAGLLSLVQMGAIEVHCWGSTADNLERPDRLVFDLDPDPGINFTRLKSAAKIVRDTLARAGLPPLLKTTGGKGLHLVVPIVPNVEWDTIKPLCKEIAANLARTQPELFTDNVGKAARKGRIFVDYLRNSRSATAVALFSARSCRRRDFDAAGVERAGSPEIRRSVQAGVHSEAKPSAQRCVEYV